jgi:hypothetical protein
MVDAVIANQTHVVVGEDSQSADRASQSADRADSADQSADRTSQSADSAGQSAGGSGPPSQRDSNRRTAPSPSEPQTSRREDGGGWSPLLVKSSLIGDGNRFSSRQLDHSSDWTPAGRPSSRRRD